MHLPGETVDYWTWIESVVNSLLRTTEMESATWNLTYSELWVCHNHGCCSWQGPWHPGEQRLWTTHLSCTCLPEKTSWEVLLVGLLMDDRQRILLNLFCLCPQLSLCPPAATESQKTEKNQSQSFLRLWKTASHKSEWIVDYPRRWCASRHLWVGQIVCALNKTPGNDAHNLLSSFSQFCRELFEGQGTHKLGV